MKTLLITMATLLVYAVGAQTHSDKIVRELAFEKSNENNTLILANINGSMKVEGYNGTKVLIEVTRVLTAKTDAGLEKAKQEVVVEQIDRADTLIVYVNDGCNHFSYDTKFRKHKGWAYSGHHDAGCDMLYDYKTEFIVKVPYAIHLNVSTINAGDISVENVSGMVVANNINGSIKLKDLKSATKATTINGNVDLEYAGNPTKDCRYYTLNGNINAWFQKGLAANLSFKSFNGELFSNVAQLESLPVSLQREANGKIKLNGSQYKISKGGALLDFETFNGDVYLREKNEN
ncbi:MAG: hypothetical protein ACK514_16595 [Bacteroidota bacterium]|jgi:hypothetical protein|nr:hypothetical protein [Flammeovirgaceae bacterium]MCZ8068875.1 hypothetical protein [Cytophagales bacterium]